MQPLFTKTKRPRRRGANADAAAESSKKFYSQMDTFSRLHHTPKERGKVVKTANDALVSTLPTDTLRWIKRRRPKQSSQKVVLANHVERQLREIFSGIDVSGNGVIDLEELKEAVHYVKTRMEENGGNDLFRNLHSIFEQMDEDGDGTVDFQEFTNAMTGTSSSALDKATEWDIEQLYRFFVDFGINKHRNHAIATIVHFEHEVSKPLQSTNAISNANAYSKSGAGGGSGGGGKRGALVQPLVQRADKEDSELYGVFKTLFDFKLNASTVPESSSVDGANLRQLFEKKKQRSRQVLDSFLSEHQRSRKALLGEEAIDDKREEEFKLLSEKIRQQRERDEEALRKDPERLALMLKNEEIARFTSSKKNVRPATTGGFIAGSEPIAQTLLPNSCGINRVIPSKLQAKTVLEAKKDGYDMLRIAKSNTRSSYSSLPTTQMQSAAAAVSMRKSFNDANFEQSQPSQHSRSGSMMYVNIPDASGSNGLGAAVAAGADVEAAIKAVSERFQHSSNSSKSIVDKSTHSASSRSSSAASERRQLLSSPMTSSKFLSRGSSGVEESAAAAAVTSLSSSVKLTPTNIAMPPVAAAQGRALKGIRARSQSRKGIAELSIPEASYNNSSSNNNSSSSGGGGKGSFSENIESPAMKMRSPGGQVKALKFGSSMHKSMSSK